MKELTTNKQMRTYHRDRPPPTIYTEKVMRDHKLFHLLDLDRDTMKEDKANEIKQTLRETQQAATIYHHQRQCNEGKIPNAFRPHCPIANQPNRAIATLLERYGCIPTDYDNTYVPDPNPLYNDIIT